MSMLVSQPIMSPRNQAPVMQGASGPYISHPNHPPVVLSPRGIPAPSYGNPSTGPAGTMVAGHSIPRIGGGAGIHGGNVEASSFAEEAARVQAAEAVSIAQYSARRSGGQQPSVNAAARSASPHGQIIAVHGTAHGGAQGSSLVAGYEGPPLSPRTTAGSAVLGRCASSEAGVNAMSTARSQRSSAGNLQRGAPATTIVKHQDSRRERCHHELYEDAFARQRRLKDMQHNVEQHQEREQQIRVEQHTQKMRQNRRMYHTKDSRTHLEREEEYLRRRREKEMLKEVAERERETDELKECTFKPSLVKKLDKVPRTQSPRLRNSQYEGNSDLPPTTRLQQLVDRQRATVEGLRALAGEDAQLRDKLRNMHAELHDRVQREETQRVVATLQDADTEGSMQQDMIHRVRNMVAAGGHPDSAQKLIVEELVARSQEEVRRRVHENFTPMRLEAEGDLYNRRLAMVHDLEAVEAQVIALRGGTLCEEARAIGFEFGLAEQARRSLPAVPSLAGASLRTNAFPGGPTTLGQMQPGLGGRKQALDSPGRRPTSQNAELLEGARLGSPNTPQSARRQLNVPLSPGSNVSRQSSAGSGAMGSPDSKKDPLGSSVRSSSAHSACGTPGSPGSLTAARGGAPPPLAEVVRTPLSPQRNSPACDLSNTEGASFIVVGGNDPSQPRSTLPIDVFPANLNTLGSQKPAEHVVTPHIVSGIATPRKDLGNVAPGPLWNNGAGMMMPAVGTVPAHTAQTYPWPKSHLQANTVGSAHRDHSPTALVGAQVPGRASPMQPYTNSPHGLPPTVRPMQQIASPPRPASHMPCITGMPPQIAAGQPHQQPVPQNIFANGPGQPIQQKGAVLAAAYQAAATAAATAAAAPTPRGGYHPGPQQVAPQQPVALSGRP